jgi:BTB/POZ domain-containing protein KCTD9
MSRFDYQQSLQRLREVRLLSSDDAPPMLARMPCYDGEEPLGVSFFRLLVGPEGEEVIVDLSNLTLPRTFFGRSEIRGFSFQNCDLSESRLCWNDFIDVSFMDADLSRSDLRGSLYQRVDFSSACLADADLRHSTFEACTFTGADMARALLTREQGTALPLTSDQLNVVAWTEAGDYPPGG